MTSNELPPEVFNAGGAVLIAGLVIWRIGASLDALASRMDRLLDALNTHMQRVERRQDAIEEELSRRGR